VFSRFDGRPEKDRDLIHPSTIVDPGAIIADDCSVGPFCVIGANVEIGSGTSVRSHTVINGPTSIGKNNTIYQFASIGEAPQDLKYSGEPTRLVVGDGNIIREYVTLHRGTDDGCGVTTVGSDCLLMAYSHVAHDCVVGDRVIMANAASIAGHVTVGERAILGGFTCVHQFTRIGPHSLSGLGTVINRDVPPFVTVAGNHARAICINRKGLQRRGFSRETIAALHTAFRVLIKSRGLREQSLMQLKPLIEDFPEVQQFVEFVTSSERSVVR
jgi:UDP-N-acetylglucosamine acyltransferase